MGLVLSNMFKPSSSFLTGNSKALLLLFCLFLAALWSLAGKGLTSWLSCMWCFLVFSSLSYMVSWVRCGIWLYGFLIYVFFLSFIVTAWTQSSKLLFQFSKGHDFDIRKSMPELRFMRSARQMLLINSYIKFSDDILNILSYRADMMLWKTDIRLGKYASLP